MKDTSLRRRIYEVIEVSDRNDKLGYIYDIFQIIVIFLSIVPLAFKQEPTAFIVIDKITVSIFIIDYILRLMTADYKFNDKSVKSFIKYPFTFFAIVDLISILPSLTVLNSGFKLLRLLRMVRAARVFRVFKVLRYSKSFRIITNVFRKSKEPLIAVFTLAAAYVLIAALVIFNVEPDSFSSFFDAVYWATVSLTTMGYGDIYPVTDAGRIVTMISSILGIAIVALPAGIVTAGYMKAINEDEAEKTEPSAE